MKFNDLLGHYQARVESNLIRLLKEREAITGDVRLLGAMKYSLLNGGKRMRPILVYLANQVCHGQIEQADSAACAVEVIHSYSLVHDDLPAMDNDDLRRGVPTCHIQYDEATAILVGDALLSWSFELLCETQRLEPSIVLEMVRVLSQASGDPGMVAGQSIDLASVGQSLDLDTLRNMHRLKTGALINAALKLGALSARATTEQTQALVQYGDALGLAFQIRDDILDLESDTETLGKPQGSDEMQNKPTYPALLGVQQSYQWLDQLCQEAKSALNCFDSDRTQPLKDLADFAIQRTH